MTTSTKLAIVLDTKKIYEEKGQSAVFDYVNNLNHESGEPIPLENCDGCETSSPSLDHVCLVCGGLTIPNKAKFYQAVLKPVKDVMETVYPKKIFGVTTLKERLGDDYGCCSECGHNEWMLLPKESVAVKQGGKAYIECLTCGNSTHL